ncbi:MAG: hypothetical protein EOP82_15950 [Variovorax sp.]|nr:MAG: hypothetical protein EOP82_15950 [Variovorax sp.]
MWSAGPSFPTGPAFRGQVDSFSIEPSLPPGIAIDSQTGVIRGTPTAISAATIYAVKATNSRGSAVGRMSWVALEPTAGARTRSSYLPRPGARPRLRQQPTRVTRQPFSRTAAFLSQVATMQTAGRLHRRGL